VFLAVAKKWRTSSFPCSAKEQACSGWEGAQPGSLPKLANRNIPYHMMSCSAYKAGRRRRKGRTFEAMAFAFPSNRYTWWSPAFLERLNTCLLVGSSEWIPCFGLLVCAAFTLPVKLFFISAHEFSHFFPSNSVLHPTEGEASKQLSGA